MNAQLESMCDGGYYYSNARKGSRFDAGYTHDYNYALGGTPLDESLMFLRDYIADFKHNYSIDKLQFVTLTDGDSFRMNGFNGWRNDHMIHDRRTKTTFEYNSNGGRNGTNNLLKWIERTTGVDTVGFFICPNKHREFDATLLTSLVALTSTGKLNQKVTSYSEEKVDSQFQLLKRVDTKSSTF